MPPPPPAGERRRPEGRQEGAAGRGAVVASESPREGDDAEGRGFVQFKIDLIGY